MAAKSLNGQHYRFQLTIKDLLTSPKISARNQEIVYRDKVRYTYSDLFERINRLGSALNSLGVKQGDTVAVFDYDSHRYLESFFAIPMLGAVLFTVNWRLSPDQIEYTINHAQADVVFINADFLPLLASIRDKLKTVKKVVLLNDNTERCRRRTSTSMGNTSRCWPRHPRITTFRSLMKTPRPPPFTLPGQQGFPRGCSSPTGNSFSTP